MVSLRGSTVRVRQRASLFEPFPEPCSGLVESCGSDARRRDSTFAGETRPASRTPPQAATSLRASRRSFVRARVALCGRVWSVSLGKLAHQNRRRAESS